MKVYYVTGNENKAKYFSKVLGIDIDRISVDIEELQSFDLEEVVTHKVKTAYEQVKKPVIVEDTSLVINVLGKLPGTMIKHFLDEIGAEKICKMVSIFDDKTAYATAAMAFYDGKELHVVSNKLDGEIVDIPRGDHGFGWNPIFRPLDLYKTFGEMNDEEFTKYYKKVKPFDQMKDFLVSKGVS